MIEDANIREHYFVSKMPFDFMDESCSVQIVVLNKNNWIIESGNNFIVSVIY